MIFLNTHMDLFILRTDKEKFTSTNKKTLHLIFKTSRYSAYIAPDARTGWPQNAIFSMSLRINLTICYNNNTFICLSIHLLFIYYLQKCINLFILLFVSVLIN